MTATAEGHADRMQRLLVRRPAQWSRHLLARSTLRSADASLPAASAAIIRAGPRPDCRSPRPPCRSSRFGADGSAGICQSAMPPSLPPVQREKIGRVWATKETRVGGSCAGSQRRRLDCHSRYVRAEPSVAIARCLPQRAGQFVQDALRFPSHRPCFAAEPAHGSRPAHR